MRLAIGIAALLTLCMGVVPIRGSTLLHGRSASDVCGDVDGELIVPGPFGIKIPVGFIDKCICESQIPTLVKTDPIFIEAVIIAGEATVQKEVTKMLEASTDHQTCSYPDNAEPVCSKSAPCGFKCKNGFTPWPEKDPVDCVCKPPFKVCNGVCGAYKACPSGKPWRRDTLRKRAVCGKGLTACGIYGRTSSIGDVWECINTQTDLESCGGCATPLDAFSRHGIDCTAIPGVVDVSCLEGSCVVHQCAPGYEVSDDDTFCMTLGGIFEQKHAWSKARA